MVNLVKFVGMNIREIRKSKKLTQEELSERAGLQTSFLAGVERGERNITLETLEKILIGLEVDPYTFFNFTNINPAEHLNKKEIVQLLVNMLESKTLEETNLIYTITKGIFNTYK